ncbi:MAG: hypothetical protein RIM84_26045 [Alphaproteobacteria bacterium]
MPAKPTYNRLANKGLLFGFALAIFALTIFALASFAKQLASQPNDRTTQEQPIPRFLRFTTAKICLDFSFR